MRPRNSPSKLSNLPFLLGLTLVLAGSFPGLSRGAGPNQEVDLTAHGKHKARHKKPEPEVPPPDVSLEQRQQKAADLTERAYKLQRKGAVNDAIQLYQEALGLDPLPKRYYNLGIPLEQAGRLAEALSAYRHFQRDDQGELPEYRQEVDQRIADIIKQLGRVSVAANPDDEVTVMVRLVESTGDRPSCVADAAVKEAGRISVGYLCQPGQVHAELLINGQAVAAKETRIVAAGAARVDFVSRSPVRFSGNRKRVMLLLDKVDREGPKAPRSIDWPPLSLSAPRTIDREGPKAPRSIDGPLLSLSAPVKLPLSVPLLPGAHEVEARDGRDVVVRRFTVLEGQPESVDLHFPPSRRWVPWVIGGAVVVVAAAVVLGVVLTPAPAGGADVTLPVPMSLK